MVNFMVDDVEGILERCPEHGVIPVRRFDDQPNGSFAHILDPEGRRLELREPEPTNTLRWEDYTQTAVDPLNDCTIWYVGDYYKGNAETYSTRIGAFRMPGCEGEEGGR